MHTRRFSLILSLPLLFLFPACDSRDDSRRIRGDIHHAELDMLPRSDFIVHSGLIDGGVALRKNQRMVGALPDPCFPDNRIWLNDLNQFVFAGFADLTINETVVPLTVHGSDPVTAAAISPLNPEKIIWTFATDFDLRPGQNIISIDLFDYAGVHRATSGEWSMLGAVADEDHRLDVLVGAPDLEKFPHASLTVIVTDPSGGHRPVSGLKAEHFTVIVAGRPTAPFLVAEHSGFYELHFMDITCGRRDVHVHVLYTHPVSFANTGGLSAPLVYGSSRAVLVGIADYPGTFNNLDYPVDDVNDLYDVLTTGASWPAETITRLTDRRATRSAVLEAVNNDIAGMKPYDRFLFFFSGHGAAGGDENTQYICTYENDQWISVADLNAAIRMIPRTGGRLVNGFVLLDACHSGNFISDRAPKGARPKSRPFTPQQPRAAVPTPEEATFAKHLKGVDDRHILVMTAVDGDQSAWDDWELENGVFTYYLVEGLTCSPETPLAGCANPIGLPASPANRDRDVWITGGEAFDWLDVRVRAWVTEENGFPPGETQEPRIQGGDVLARFVDST